MYIIFNVNDAVIFDTCACGGVGPENVENQKIHVIINCQCQPGLFVVWGRVDART